MNLVGTRNSQDLSIRSIPFPSKNNNALKPQVSENGYSVNQKHARHQPFKMCKLFFLNFKGDARFKKINFFLTRKSE